MTQLLAPQVTPTQSPPPVRSGPVTVRLVPLPDLPSEIVSDWAELARDSDFDSCFLSPQFVQSAAACLPEVSQPRILYIQQGSQLLGLGAFEAVPSSRRLPLPHLRAWQTPHTYLDGMLVRAGAAEFVGREFFRFLSQEAGGWHGVEFPRSPIDDPVATAFERVATEQQIRSCSGAPRCRAALVLRNVDHQEPLQAVSIKRAKSLRRGWRELARRGPVRFEVVTDPAELLSSARDLLRLENLGWKSAERTALAAQPGHSEFLLQLVERSVADQSVFFSRILVGEETIASVLHLRAGRTAFAFKLGWNPEFERGCPGYQLKFQLASGAEGRLPGIELVDSCSAPGSFIENVWPDRRMLSSRLYVTSSLGATAAGLVDGVRWVRDRARELQGFFKTKSAEHSA